MSAGKYFVRTVLGVALLALATGCPKQPAATTAREKLEQAADDAGKSFVLVPYAIPDGRGARSVFFTRKTLEESEFYLRDAQSQDYLLVNSMGVVFRNEDHVGQVQSKVELLLTPNEVTLFIDSAPLEGNFKDWQIGWLSRTGTPPKVASSAAPLIDFVDAFTRTELTKGSCRIEGGRWWLRKRGGGMPTSALQAEEDRFQRAVNPFSARGSDNGRLTYGDPTWIDCIGAASFYFGLPRDGQVIDRDSLPDNTDMVLLWGAEDGPGVQFGWIGDSRAFELRYRDSAESNWRTLAVYDGPRPAVTNWFRLELAVSAGYRLVARLDGIDLFRAELPRKITGPFSLGAGLGPIEFDDVQIRSLALEDSNSDALLRRSELFADKDLKDQKRDPKQFLEWARGSETFVHWAADEEQGLERQTLRAMTRLPFLADFEYSSQFEDGGQPVDERYHGTYTFSFVPTDCLETDEKPSGSEHLLDFSMKLEAEGWSALTLPDSLWPAGMVNPRLKFRRRAADDGRISFDCDGVWRPLGPPVPGTVRVLIAFQPDSAPELPPRPIPPMMGSHHGRQRVSSQDLAAYRESMERYRALQFAPVSADRHAFRSTGLSVEMFEESPVDWAWIDGAFRMDARWACQDDWNFMACGSQAVPMVTSKKTFNGDQVHEYYLSLRPVFPWEVGDKSFDYDNSQDRHHRIFRANGGWYNRRDFDFSFCFDGRNPLSGYTVMFGTDDNTETRLLRRGKVVATTTHPTFLFPATADIHAVHWKWWKFTVSRIGNRVQVRLNDDLMFDYEDPDPLPGGHMALWSIRNGFAVARINSAAAEVGWAPQVLYVDDSPSAPWRPIPADSATTKFNPGTAMTEATRNTGSGFFALRYALPGQLDLSTSPVLNLPLELDDNAAVNLHLEIGGRAYVVQINAPLDHTKSLLAPEFEKGECFRIPDMVLNSSYRNLGRAEMRGGVLTVDVGRALDRLNLSVENRVLTSLTLGNTSNAQNLLIGGGGFNSAGTRLRAGRPQFVAREAVQ
jgi:hypothetical protein